MTKENQHDEILITLSDFFRPLQKSWKTILGSAIAVGLLACCFTLARPPRYKVEASFRERATAKEAVGDSQIKQMILSSDIKSSQSAAVSTISSLNMYGRLVRKLNLHGTIKPKGCHIGILDRFYNNLQIEFAYLTNSQYPALPDQLEELYLEGVLYEKETPQIFEITFSKDDTFSITNEHGEFLGKGEIGKQFSCDQTAFTLHKSINTSLNNQTYTLSFISPILVAQSLSKRVTVESNPKDTSLIQFSYVDSDRHYACKIVNGLMDIYRNYLQEENNRTSQEQIAYLKERKDDVGQGLREMMYDHAESISSDIFHSGYPNSALAMEFLFTEQTELKTKLAEVDLEIARVETAIKEGYGYYERHHPLDVTTMYPKLIRDIRELKKDADILDLALRNSCSKDCQVRNQLFILQFAELDTIHHTIQEAQALLQALEKGENTLPPIDLLDTQYYMVKTWLQKLKHSSFEDSERAEQEFFNNRTNFIAYLKKLVHLLSVNEKTVRERLVHQQNPQTDFQGVDLEFAKKLYIEYHAELNELEIATQKHQFILKQIYVPEFEISSLSGSLTDPVSQQIISRAGNLKLEISDLPNRTSREQDRLKSELNLQKEFLAMHIEQTIQLEEIQQKLLRNKVKSLQSSTLNLTQQEISLLEKHLADYFHTRLSSLFEERKSIDKYITDLNSEFSKLPEKWIQEKLIEHHLSMGQRMVEQVSQLVETKNLASNLEFIQSSPLDVAIAPINPKRPHIFLFAIAGAILGGFFATCFCVARSVVEGVSASENNLRLAGVHTSGSITRTHSGSQDRMSTDQDLATLRRLMGYMNETHDTHDKLVVLITGSGHDYSSTLASLYAKSGERVLLLPLCFDKPSPTEELPGILQYLEGEAEVPNIVSENGYDRITAGGITRYGSEMISTSKFQQLIDTYRQKYDRILAVSHGSPTSAEAERLISRHSQVAISLTGEQLEQLMTLIHYGRQNHKRITFVFSNNT